MLERLSDLSRIDGGHTFDFRFAAVVICFVTLPVGCVAGDGLGDGTNDDSTSADVCTVFTAARCGSGARSGPRTAFSCGCGSSPSSSCGSNCGPVAFSDCRDCSGTRNTFASDAVAEDNANVGVTRLTEAANDLPGKAFA